MIIDKRIGSITRDNPKYKGTVKQPKSN